MTARSESAPNPNDRHLRSLPPARASRRRRAYSIYDVTGTGILLAVTA